MSLAIQRSKHQGGVFDFLGDVAGTALGLAGGILPGPIGGVVQGIGGAIIGESYFGKPISGPRAMPGTGGIGTPPLVSPVANRPLALGPTQEFPVIKSGGFKGMMERAVPGGATGYEVQHNGQEVPQQVRAWANRAGRPSPRRGHHFNKTGYMTMAGYVFPGQKQVRNRRRNPMNPKALDRAIGRVSSAKKLSEKLSRVTIRKKKSC